MRRIVVAVGGFVVAVLLIGGLTAGIGAAQPADADKANDTSELEETGTTLGGEVSSFMQASEAETESEVDDGMFNAALNRTADADERRALIEERTQHLEARNQTLQTQRKSLAETPQTGVQAQALATRVAIGASGLERSVNRTAAATGTEAEAKQLGELRSNARQLQRPDVAERTPELARESSEIVRGPPESAADRSADNETDQRNGVSAEDQAGDNDENRSDTGAPPDENRSSGPAGTGSDAAPDNRSGGPPDTDSDTGGERGQNASATSGGSAAVNESQRPDTDVPDDRSGNDARVSNGSVDIDRSSTEIAASVDR